MLLGREAPIREKPDEEVLQKQQRIPAQPREPHHTTQANHAVDVRFGHWCDVLRERPKDATVEQVGKLRKDDHTSSREAVECIAEREQQELERYCDHIHHDAASHQDHSRLGPSTRPFQHEQNNACRDQLVKKCLSQNGYGRGKQSV